MLDSVRLRREYAAKSERYRARVTFAKFLQRQADRGRITYWQAQVYGR